MRGEPCPESVDQPLLALPVRDIPGASVGLSSLLEFPLHLMVASSLTKGYHATSSQGSSLDPSQKAHSGRGNDSPSPALMAAQSLPILTQTKSEVSGMPEAENRKGQKLTGKKGEKEGHTQRRVRGSMMPGSSEKWGLEKRSLWYTPQMGWGGYGTPNGVGVGMVTGQRDLWKEDRV